MMIKSKKYNNKSLKRNFKYLLDNFNSITIDANSYDIKLYLELLRELKSEVNYEFQLIENEINENINN